MHCIAGRRAVVARRRFGGTPEPPPHTPGLHVDRQPCKWSSRIATHTNPKPYCDMHWRCAPAAHYNTMHEDSTPLRLPAHGLQTKKLEPIKCRTTMCTAGGRHVGQGYAGAALVWRWAVALAPSCCPSLIHIQGHDPVSSLRSTRKNGHGRPH